MNIDTKEIREMLDTPYLRMYRPRLTNLCDAYDEAQNEIKKLSAVLELYAKKTNWTHPNGPGPERYFAFIPSLRSFEPGYKEAREALQAVEKLEEE